MSNLFTRLEELSTQLNESSDSLSESIKRVEAKLASLRLGVSVWVEDATIDTERCVSREGDVEGEIYIRLGYTKIDGKWCLAIGDEKNNFQRGYMEEGYKLLPLLQAPREHRVRALQLIPRLIKALEAGAEAELKAVQSVTDISNTV